MSSSARLRPNPVPRRLQILTAACSLVFAAGSALHNFWVVDTDLIATMMRMAGSADPEGSAPGFTTGFRIVGCGYVLGNALGMLALVSRSRLLWWWVLAVNVTQGLGWIMIPSQMWSAARAEHGIAGLLPSAVTDGGAVLLVLVLVAAYVRFRAPWGAAPVLTAAPERADSAVGSQA